jgi:hypothetical protein
MLGVGMPSERGSTRAMGLVNEWNFGKRAAGVAVALLACWMAGFAAHAHAQDAIAKPVAPTGAWPSKVAAVYKISFNGFDIGEFKFNSEVTGDSYTLTGNAQLSALLGAFTWSGDTRSAGNVSGELPRPAGYTFDFRSNSKSGGVKMGFTNGAVSNIVMVPKSDGFGTVPVRDFHLKGVLDPLTAVMALSRSQSNNPCGRKLAVFDGKHRFDLILSFRRQQRLAEARPSGQPGLVFVCSVRYIPVAGHKNNDETRAMAANGNIEISLRPVPSANLFVPYQISIPTPAGTAVLTARRIDIVTPNQRQIALVN